VSHSFAVHDRRPGDPQLDESGEDVVHLFDVIYDGDE
jgi:hypothetical protein